MSLITFCGLAFILLASYEGVYSLMCRLYRLRNTAVDVRLHYDLCTLSTYQGTGCIAIYSIQTGIRKAIPPGTVADKDSSHPK